MIKQEFLDELRIALNGRVSSSEVIESIRYYEEFIATKIRSGQTEEEILDNLGDPRLIARSIIDVQKAAGQDAGQKDEYNSTDTYEESNLPRKRIPGWLITLIVVFVVIFIIGTIFSILSFLLPFIIPVVLILGFIRVIQRR